MSTKTKSNSQSKQQVRHGWAASVCCEDGAKFLAMGGEGVASAVWPLSNRKAAAQFERDMTAHSLNARVVRVTYTEPQIVPNAKATKGKTNA